MGTPEGSPSPHLRPRSDQSGDQRSRSRNVMEGNALPETTEDRLPSPRGPAPGVRRAWASVRAGRGPVHLRGGDVTWRPPRGAKLSLNGVDSFSTRLPADVSNSVHLATWLVRRLNPDLVRSAETQGSATCNSQCAPCSFRKHAEDFCREGTRMADRPWEDAHCYQAPGKGTAKPPRDHLHPTGWERRVGTTVSIGLNTEPP